MKKFDELTVKSLYDDFMSLDGVKDYFPDKFPKGRVVDRTFMFNVVNTLHPAVVKEIVDHAITQRYDVKVDE